MNDTDALAVPISKLGTSAATEARCARHPLSRGPYRTRRETRRPLLLQRPSELHYAERL